MQDFSSQSKIQQEKRLPSNKPIMKFFRHIRYNLIEKPISVETSSGNKTGKSTEASRKASKYVKYAIGEIILVVVGPAV